MATTSFSTMVFTCDRCKRTHSFPESTVPADWLTLNGQSRSGAPVTAGAYKIELCGDCSADFKAWLEPAPSNRQITDARS